MNDLLAAVAEALVALGADRLTLGIHESAFPAGAVDIGHGSAHAGGPALLAFARALGFNALQLGPRGQLPEGNPSPYDGTVYARNACSLDLAALCEPEFGALLDRDELARVVPEAGAAAGARADLTRARRGVHRALTAAHTRFVRLRRDHPEHPLVQAFEAFRTRAAPWLELEALFEVMAERTGHDDPAHLEPAVVALFERSESGKARRAQVSVVLRDAIERVELEQFLLDVQARAFLAHARSAGVELFADLQVGWSRRDRFLRPELFTPGWVMGAPPSRTNPAGQPWGYPVLDPDQLDDVGSPARRAFALQVERAFEHHDGLRIDHPHGLVCPFIYHPDASDPHRAVVQGTRAFESPDCDDPALRRWAIARSEQLDPAAGQRFAERWVRWLDPEQVVRYSRLVDAVLEVAAHHGRRREDLALEVLSTCPTPLRCVLERHGLGRFVVTQKADPCDPNDVYRTDRARPQDWVMLGTHDTPPIRAVAARWLQDGSAAERAAYLAARLEPAAQARAAAQARYCASPEALAQAHLSDLFLSDARNVSVYFTDLFGEDEPFNRAGEVHPDNWTQRLPSDFAQVYVSRCRAGRALDIAAALAAALRARGARPDLARALEPHAH